MDIVEAGANALEDLYIFQETSEYRILPNDHVTAKAVLRAAFVEMGLTSYLLTKRAEVLSEDGWATFSRDCKRWAQAVASVEGTD